jgi:DNA-directed RNA polymerase subunit beta
MSTIPGFSQIQFEGFCRFINKALAEELDKFPTIKDPYHEISFKLFGKGYQLLEPSILKHRLVSSPSPDLAGIRRGGEPNLCVEGLVKLVFSID